MSYTYLQEQEEASLAGCFADIPPYVLSRLNLTAEKSYSKDNETEYCQSSQSGTTFAPLMEHPGEGKLMWFAGDFPALIYPKSNKEQKVSRESHQDYGARWQELPMKCDQDTFLLRTHHSLFTEDLDKSCVTFPEWGMMLDGEFWEHATPTLHTLGTGFGYWATPNARDWKDTMGMSKQRKDGRMKIDQTSRQVYTSVDGSGLFAPPTAPETWMMSMVSMSVQNADMNMENASVLGQQWTTLLTKLEMTESMPNLQTGGHLNPAFSEWLMGWVIEWTDLKPLEMDKFQQWQQWHGKFSQNNK